MTPEELRNAIADNSVDAQGNSYGSCSHGTSFAMHCGKCEMEKYSISQRSPGWFEKQAREVTNQVSAGVVRLRQSEQRYERHTVDIRNPPPVHVEAEALAFEHGWRRAKIAWVVLFVLVAAYVAWRVV